MSGLDWFPTFVAAAGDPNIAAELRQGKHLSDSTFKVPLEGYDQTNLLTGKGVSDRRELFYFAEDALGAIRIDDRKYRFINQPNGRLGGAVNLIGKHRHFAARSVRTDGLAYRAGGSLDFYDFFVHQVWCFIYVQKVGSTLLRIPPMQKRARASTRKQ
jgi:arylsulfatase